MPDDIETIAKQRVQARSSFFVHLFIYAVMNTGFVLIWGFTGSGYPWFIWPMVFWGAGLAAHAITLWVGPGSAREQRAIEREVQRLRPRAIR